MSILRFIVDIEATDGEDAVTSGDFDEMADVLGKYADSVVGVQYLGSKQGDDKNVSYHVHVANDDYACADCRAAAADGRH